MKNFLNIVLWPFSLLYGGFMALRNCCFDLGICTSVVYDVPVISVGNITVGGTGKTPHIEYLIRLLRTDNNLAVLSRGYGRKTKGFRWLDVDSVPDECGDEPCQIKQKFPELTVAVCEDRREGMRRILERGQCDVVLLDDAFQHRWVMPSLSLLLVDYARPLFKDAVMPAGRLREFPSGVKRADCVLVTKCPSDVSDEEKGAFQRRLKLHSQSPFFTNFKYGDLQAVFDASMPMSLDFEEILLVTGIAQTQSLEDYLCATGAQVNLLSYSDHHLFSLQDVDVMWQNFKDLPSTNKCIITTEKDAVRLRQLKEVPEGFKASIYYIPIEVNVIDGEQQLNKILLSHVRKNK